ncbi:MAG TPA: ester cyclase [Caulobacteraceae bacterium]|nr:ester cyclase [Caulobacteraceae bacterium]
MSENNKAIVKRVVDEHWNKKNAAIAAELIAEDCALHTPDGALRGVEGARRLLNAYATAFPDFHITTDELIAEGDKVAFRYTFAGTHQGKLGEVAASGKKVTTSGIGIYRIVGGKVAEGRLEWDRASLQEQIGSAAPAKSAMQPA